MRAHAVSQFNVEPSRPATTISQTTLHSPSLARSTRNTRALDSRVPPLAVTHASLCSPPPHRPGHRTQLSLHIDVPSRLLPHSLPPPAEHMCRHASALVAPYFQILRLLPAVHARSCLSHVDSCRRHRILHVYLPALPYDILRHMSGYVRLLLLTYSAVAPFSPPTRTHACFLDRNYLSLNLDP